MQSRLTLRSVRQAEIPEVAALIRHVIQMSYKEAYSPRAVAIFLKHHREAAVRRWAREDLLLVAERGGQIAATGSLVGSEIAGLFVMPFLPGQGIGGRLLERLEQAAIAKGRAEVSLRISVPSSIFYKNRGSAIVRAQAQDVGAGQALDYWEGRKVLA